MAYELVPEDLKILLIETESENEDEEVVLEKQHIYLYEEFLRTQLPNIGKEIYNMVEE